jgi:bifunctional UDP-N-acetylglucosamine pyrophosphorylase/glucosamine-1-phosphate N-acetyltransferase
MAAADLRICYEWMKRGVVIRDAASTFIDPSVRLGKGSVVEPFSFIQGKTTIGKNCVIGPFARVHDCRIGDSVRIEQSVVESSVFGKGCSVGPWTRVRPGCVIGAGAHLGNFCEFKNSKIGPGVKAGHLSYLGDAAVGQGANIGAGTITANYDGKNKHATRIGKRAFIGSGTVLVAPLNIGDEAMTGAGAVVLKGRHVPKGGLALGVPARIIKPSKKRKP